MEASGGRSAESSLATVNRAFLIGVVSTPVVVDDEGWHLRISVATTSAGLVHLACAEVVGDARLVGTACELRHGERVYVDGSLGQGAGGVVVWARRLLSLDDPPAARAADAAEPRQAHHSPPRAHQRAGHARVLHRGTPRERVIRVRSSNIGGRARGGDVG